MHNVRTLCLGILVFVAIFAIGTQWMWHICLPWNLHTLRWQCDLGVYLPAVAAVAAGFAVGLQSKAPNFLVGPFVPILGLLLLSATPLLRGWYGEDLRDAFLNAVLYCVAPTAIAAWVSRALAARSSNALQLGIARDAYRRA